MRLGRAPLLHEGGTEVSGSPSPLSPHRFLIAETLKPVLETIGQKVKQQGLESHPENSLNIAITTVMQLHLSKYGRAATIRILEELLLAVRADELSTSLSTDG
jgi:hypothetical protein